MARTYNITLSDSVKVSFDPFTGVLMVMETADWGGGITRHKLSRSAPLKVTCYNNGRNVIYIGNLVIVYQEAEHPTLEGNIARYWIMGVMKTPKASTQQTDTQTGDSK